MFCSGMGAIKNWFLFKYLGGIVSMDTIVYVQYVGGLQ